MNQVTVLPCIGSSKPVITPDLPHLVILKGGQLELRCEDSARFDASRLRWYRDKGRRIEGEQVEDGATVIDLASILPHHMGRYTCESTRTGEKSSIYIYVKGEHVRRHSLWPVLPPCSFHPVLGLRAGSNLSAIFNCWLKVETTPQNGPSFLSAPCLI